MKKGRVGVLTRPQPTIFGNCDSWSFIVGKKRGIESLVCEISIRCDETTKIYTHLMHRIKRKAKDDCELAVDSH
jgi:hypothetical protein